MLIYSGPPAVTRLDHLHNADLAQSRVNRLRIDLQFAVEQILAMHGPRRVLIVQDY